MYGLTETEIRTITAILEKHPEVKQAILFGSRAKGNFRPASDVDISLKGDDIDHTVVNTISMELNEETMMPYHFDILNFNTVRNTELTQHIERVGKLLYQRI